MTKTAKGCLIAVGSAVGLFVVMTVVMVNLPPDKQQSAPSKADQGDARMAEKEKAKALREAADKTAKEAAFLKTPAGRLWQKHKDWDRDACEAIVQKKVYIGMTMEQARMSWGSPKDVHNTTSSFGTHTQWCYHEYCDSALYFDNGVLTSIQN